MLAHARVVAGGLPVPVDVEEMLTGRAALLGLAPPGRISAGGATRLLPAADRWCALTLSRADDLATVPALLEREDADDDPWPAITHWVAGRPAEEAVARARLLGLPAAVLGETPATAPVVRAHTRRAAPRPLRDVLVADLSSMWAGPLCGRLLADAGATVVKVESRTRPDGTRGGAPAFFGWVNTGKLCYVIDFGAEELRELLAVADMVIEGSRPAALIRRGLGPDAVPARDGRVWLRITGYGTAGECAERVAFGDDAAVAGGLVGMSGDGPVFTGDAIADPLTGLAAARAAFDSLRRGGGELIEVSMAAVAATYAALPTGADTEVAARRPAPSPPAPKLGAGNAAVRALVEQRLVTC
nr:CoA transferase [Mycobacterium sp. PS03-16]